MVGAGCKPNVFGIVNAEVVMALNESGAISCRGYLEEFPTDNFQINFKSKTKSQLRNLPGTSGIANDKHENPG